MNIQHHNDKTIIDNCNDHIITDGSTSRFIFEDWIKNDFEIDATAFDLRDTKPPETYVSFFMVDGDDLESKVCDAKTKIPKRLISKGGAILVLEIDQCIDDINDDVETLISFQEEKLPHCGLYYTTTDLQKIVEAKNSLCLLAKENFLKIEVQNKSLTNNSPQA